MYYVLFFISVKLYAAYTGAHSGCYVIVLHAPHKIFLRPLSRVPGTHDLRRGCDLPSPVTITFYMVVMYTYCQISSERACTHKRWPITESRYLSGY